MHRLHIVIRTACQISEKMQTRKSRARAAPRLGRRSEPFSNVRLLWNRGRFALSKNIQNSLIAFERTSKFLYQFGLFSNFEWIFQDSLKTFSGCQVANVFSWRFCVDWYLDAGWKFAGKLGMPVGENAITGILIAKTRKYREWRDADKGKWEHPL